MDVVEVAAGFIDNELEDERLDVLVELAGKRDQILECLWGLRRISAFEPEDAEVLGPVLPALEILLLHRLNRVNASIDWTVGRFTGPRPQHLDEIANERNHHA